MSYAKLWIRRNWSMNLSFDQIFVLRILSKQTVVRFGLLMIFSSMTWSEFVMIPNFETPTWTRIERRNNYWLRNRILPMLLPGYYDSMMMEFSLFSVFDDDCCLWRNEREEKLIWGKETISGRFKKENHSSSHLFNEWVKLTIQRKRQLSEKNRMERDRGREIIKRERERERKVCWQ